jgi:hypothetical protein
MAVSAEPVGTNTPLPRYKQSPGAPDHVYCADAAQGGCQYLLRRADMYRRLGACKWVSALGSALTLAMACSGIAAASTSLDGIAFNPSSIVAGGESTMSFTFTNSSGVIETVDLTDTFPAGLENGPGGVTWTVSGCAFPVFSRSNGPLAKIGINIQVYDGHTCVVSAPVTAASPGTYINSLQNLSGLSFNVVLPLDSTATLQVQSAAPAIVPTMSAWLLMVLTGGIVLGAWRLRRQRPSAS